MKNPENNQENHEEKDKDKDKDKGFVIITINDNQKQIHPGSRAVSEIKTLGNVPAEYVLEQVVDGNLTELKEGDKVRIRGGEVFFGHPRSGGSS
jgi:hypothetical protein